MYLEVAVQALKKLSQPEIIYSQYIFFFYLSYCFLYCCNELESCIVSSSEQRFCILGYSYEPSFKKSSGIIRLAVTEHTTTTGHGGAMHWNKLGVVFAFMPLQWYDLGCNRPVSKRDWSSTNVTFSVVITILKYWPTLCTHPNNNFNKSKSIVATREEGLAVDVCRHEYK